MIAASVLAPLVGYTSRVLPPAEWSRLAGTEAAIAQQLDPKDTMVLVVEQDGQIVGTWVVMRIVHAECVWIHPDHRGRLGVVKRLLSGMRAIAKNWGATVVWTSATSREVRALIRKLHGTRIPGEAYALPVEDPCPRSSSPH